VYYRKKKQPKVFKTKMILPK